MWRTIAAAAGLALVTLEGQGAPPRVNLVADAIRGIHSADSSAALLLVLVVDDQGDPLDEVAVTVSSQIKTLEAAKTDARGRALFTRAEGGVVSVRAEDAGLVPSEAHGVVLRRGGLTAVVLPLEEAAPRR
jgi:hypothetical protein